MIAPVEPIPPEGGPYLPLGEGGPSQWGMRAVRRTDAEKIKANSHHLPGSLYEFAPISTGG